MAENDIQQKQVSDLSDNEQQEQNDESETVLNDAEILKETDESPDMISIEAIIEEESSEAPVSEEIDIEENQALENETGNISPVIDQGSENTTEGRLPTGLRVQTLTVVPHAMNEENENTVTPLDVEVKKETQNEAPQSSSKANVLSHFVAMSVVLFWIGA